MKKSVVKSRKLETVKTTLQLNCGEKKQRISHTVNTTGKSGNQICTIEKLLL